VELKANQKKIAITLVGVALLAVVPVDPSPFS
jgi:hypothetical protein